MVYLQDCLAAPGIIKYMDFHSSITTWMPTQLKKQQGTTCCFTSQFLGLTI